MLNERLLPTHVPFVAGVYVIAWLSERRSRRLWFTLTTDMFIADLANNRQAGRHGHSGHS